MKEVDEFIEAVKELPEIAANRSRDFGRGYSAAIHDVILLVRALGRDWQAEDEQEIG